MLFRSRINLGLTDRDDRLWISDARKVIIPKVDGKLLIVTEPDLGPIWRIQPYYNDINVVIKELVRLYSDSLNNWRNQISTGTRIVMVFPIIFGHSTFERIVDTLTILGYSTSTSPLLYERDDQKIRRNIVKLVAV